jgi:hypothetical protein
MKEPKEDGRMVNGHQYYRSCSKDTPNQEWRKETIEDKTSAL